jgi:serine/threonine-protein phosphatase PGAM5
MKIILLRHGQYFIDPKTKKEQLTKLGRKQARLAGKRLKEYEIQHIVHSTMPRAIETTQLVLEKLDYKKKLEATDLVRECTPGFSKKVQKRTGVKDLSRFQFGKKQLDKAFKTFFKNSKLKNKTILIVCHGNVIRYLVCKTLGIDTDKWTNMDIQQCGITIIQCNRIKNELELISHNDIGHIKYADRTFI